MGFEYVDQNKKEHVLSTKPQWILVGKYYLLQPYLVWLLVLRPWLGSIAIHCHSNLLQWETQ